MSSDSKKGSMYRKRPHSLLIITVLVIAMRCLWNNSGMSNIFMPLSLENRKRSRKRTRVAVVYSANEFDDECKEARLRHWAETIQSNATGDFPMLDIWVTYGRTSQRFKERRYNKIISSIPGLKQHFKRSREIETFDTEVSGSSKSSFLHFAHNHSQQYDYLWLVEDDVVFSGPWRDFIADSFMDDTDDPQNTIFVPFSFNKSQAWRHYDDCTWNSDKCGSLGTVQQTGWQILRFPVNLAVKLWQEVSSKKLVGHHEAVLGTFCELHGCKIQTIPSRWLGSVQSGHSDCMEPTIPTDRWEPRKLYHPVPCWAFPGQGGMANALNEYY